MRVYSRIAMSLRRGVLILAGGCLLAAPAPPFPAAMAADDAGSASALRTETRSDADGPYASRSQGPDGRWLLPSGDAVLLDEAWWTPQRPLADLAIDPPAIDPAILRRVRATVAPAATARTPDRLTAAAMGDITGDGKDDLVLSFRRPFRPTLINRTRPRSAWVDVNGDSAHLGLYEPAHVHRIWVAGTLVAPVVEVAACDGALAVAYGRLDRPGTVETGAWRWVVFGFLPTAPLPGPGKPVCVDIDGDGRTEPAMLERSEP